MRKLTVSSIYQRRRRGEVRAAQIRLVGRWLELAGFAAGTPVHVTAGAGQLVITTEAAAYGTSGSRQKGEQP